MMSRRDAEPQRDLNDISGQIVDAAIHIHMKLGPGLLESVYTRLLAYELEKRGLMAEREVPVPVVYDDIRFEEGFRADLIVEKSVIVELKSVETLAPVHSKQLLTYLRLMDYRLGLLINFGAPLLKDGIKRIANNI
jgi:iron complex transport system substrate-binding protein